MSSTGGNGQANPGSRGRPPAPRRRGNDALTWRTLVSIAEINPRTAGFALIGFFLFWAGHQFQYKDYPIFWVIVCIVFLPVVIASLKYAWAILFFGEDDRRGQ
jgi:hypothetical protein